MPLIAESIRQQCETYASVALEDEFEAQLEAVPPGEGYSTQFDDERIIVKVRKKRPRLASFLSFPSQTHYSSTLA